MNKTIGIILIIIFLLGYIGLNFIEIDNLKKANEQLKKEKYECKQELNRYKEKYLKVVIKGE